MLNTRYSYAVNKEELEREKWHHKVVTHEEGFLGWD